MYLVREKTDKNTNDLKTRHIVASDLERCLTRRNAKKSKRGLSKNQSLTMPDNCVVFTSLIQLTKNARKFFFKARRKLEVPMPAAMHCKIQLEKYRKTCRVEKKCKTNTLALLRPTSLRESAWKDLVTRIMNIILR